MRKALICMFASAILLVGCSDEMAADGENGSTKPVATSSINAEQAATDEQHIRESLNAWPGAWATRDAGAVCDLFAPDAVFVFPGGPDRTYSQACAQFTELVSGNDQTVRYEPPEVAEVLVDGDLAAVRLTWTGTISAPDGSLIEQTKERGLDVFRRQDDGNWRISISHAFPVD